MHGHATAVNKNVCHVLQSTLANPNLLNQNLVIQTASVVFASNPCVSHVLINWLVTSNKCTYLYYPFSPKTGLFGPHSLRIALVHLNRGCELGFALTRIK
jgi:hypothetical protein